jgi:ketosteroid isomerase-like protein
MSQAHVDIAKRIVEAFNRRGPSPGSWSRLAGMAEGWRDFLGAWEDWRAEATEYRELDDERVLALVQMNGRVKTSGLQTRTNGANLFHVRDGKVTKFALYLDRERAFADLGLKE